MSQNSKILIKKVKQYFDQNVHDTKNLFHSLNFWLNTPGQDNGKDQAQFVLKEMEKTYLTKITELRDEFDQFLSIATDNTSLIKLDPLADWLDAYLDDYWNDHSIPGKLIKELDNRVSLNYPTSYLRSILQSLLDNTVLYQSEDRDLIVRVTLSQDDDTVVIQVQDNGIGINVDQHRDALFQPFQRFSSKGNGKGLSLHLIKTMIEKNGGSVVLNGVPNKGTVVSVFLKNYK